MKKNILVGAIVVVLAVGGYFFWLNLYQTPALVVTESPSKTLPAIVPQIPGHSLPQGLPIPDKNTVVLSDSGYSPATLTINKGEYVVFKNESSDSMWTASAMHPTHTAYSGTSLDQHCPDSTGTAFDACRAYVPGESWSFKFDKIGAWQYHNHLSPKEWGTIIVQ